MPVIFAQPGFDPGDMGGQPLAMPKGNEVVLPAVQEQRGDSDIAQLEPPRVEVSAVVIPPSLAARPASRHRGPAELILLVSK